jgi:hypothetical protein
MSIDEFHYAWHWLAARAARRAHFADGGIAL